MYRFKEKLLDSVDMTTLIKMRDMGYTNKEIADALGTTYITIYKHIGPQRKNKRKKGETNVQD